MRVLITTSPLYGHFFPMLPLIAALRQDGHEVTVATGPDLADAVRRRNLRMWEVGPSMAEVFAGLRHRRPEVTATSSSDPAAALRRDAMATFGEPGLARTAELLPLVEAEPPDVIVHEQGDLAGWMISSRLGQRPVAHGYGPHLPMTRPLAEILLAAGVERFGFGPAGDPFGDAVYLDPWPRRLQSPEEVGYGRVLAIRPDQEPSGSVDHLPPGFERLPQPQNGVRDARHRLHRLRHAA